MATKTELLEAIKKEQLERVEELLKKKYKIQNINGRDKYNETVLSKAAKTGSLKIVEKLLEHGVCCGYGMALQEAVRKVFQQF